MYGWVWRHLPGPFVLRLGLVAVLLAAVVVVCFGWIFPALAGGWIDQPGL